MNSVSVMVNNYLTSLGIKFDLDFSFVGVWLLYLALANNNLILMFEFFHNEFTLNLVIEISI